MASAVWSALEGNAVSMTSAAATDPAAMLNSQLASALSLTGDAQYWEESISPSTIRQSLAEADPSNPTHTQTLLRGMKWLLACISKGRNVSDFYPHVVKLVGASSLEVRKMVYMYLVQYANYDTTTRELSLLSINSFQRGLADSEQLIRAYALRVLTSIQIADILQIQILGVQKCATDRSPYVRKCAANALAKLHARCCHDRDDDQQQQQQQRDVLLHLLADFLAYDDATMVLSAACIALTESCPDRLDLLHPAYGKICHLLTDMDEWGQVVVIDLLARYCRTYFAEPAGWQDGSAERIDRERRVRRTIHGIAVESSNNSKNNHHRGTNSASSNNNNNKDSSNGNNGHASSSNQMSTLPTSKAIAAAAQNVTLPPRHPAPARKIKRRIIRKGFYSDEEDESTEEEVFAETFTGTPLSVAALRDTTATTMTPASLASGALDTTAMATAPSPLTAAQNWYDVEAADLHPDHQTILKSALPLLKSRNAGVVLAVCSLHYYCGVSSVAVRAAMGKALVRIHRDQREIQYVVLASIRTLVTECPSAFSPFLHDFYVKALDPPFTRVIKLDILSSLALDPVAIRAILEELRNYVRHGDKTFATAAVRTVGKVVELARIVYDRHGALSTHPPRRAKEERREANTIGLNAMAGLLTLSQTSEHAALVGQAVITLQQILILLQQPSDVAVDDPHHIQERVRNRILLLALYSLAKRRREDDNHNNGSNNHKDDDDDDDDEDSPFMSKLGQIVAVVLPPAAMASALWFLGECLSSTLPHVWKGKVRTEVVRMIARCFPDLEKAEKEQALHLASKILVSVVVDSTTAPLCEHILSMGRLDVIPDVRDRARFESGLIQASNSSSSGPGLQHDRENLEPVPLGVSNGKNKLNASRILLAPKPVCSSLPLEQSSSHATESNAFRFGTLSSLVGHRARSAYIALPPWAAEDSSSELRQPKKRETDLRSHVANGSTSIPMPAGKFYDNGNDSSGTDSGSESSSSSSSSSGSGSSESSSDDDSDSDSSGGKGAGMNHFLAMDKTTPVTSPAPLDIFNQPTAGAAAIPVVHIAKAKVETAGSNDSSSDDDDDYDDDDDSSSDDSSDGPVASNKKSATGDLLNIPTTAGSQSQVVDMFGASVTSSKSASIGASSAAEDLKGLVMAPIVVEKDTQPEDTNFDRDSGAWTQVIRPEHSGGLLVQTRCLRGITKAREAELLGLKADSPSLVCIQFRFVNTKDSAPIRRVRILQKSSAASGSLVKPRRVVVPPEIEQLGPGQQTECVVGIEFMSPSDRDGSLQAKFDVKFGSGATPIDVRPSLGDILLPCKKTATQFDQQLGVLQGFQRVESSMSASWDSLETSIVGAAALTKVKSDGDASQLRFVGTLPACSDAIYVSAKKGNGTASHKLIVCSDNALAANSLMNVLKKALA